MKIEEQILVCKKCGKKLAELTVEGGYNNTCWQGFVPCVNYDEEAEEIICGCGQRIKAKITDGPLEIGENAEIETIEIDAY